MRKVILIILWICILAILPIVVFTYDNNCYDEDVPYIKSMVGIEILDIEMKVNKDNSIDVVETITFNQVDGNPFDGITINFPLRDNIVNNRNMMISDITSEDISVNQKRKIHNLEVSLGSELKDLSSGLYTYTLNYHYDLGKNDNDFIYKVFTNKYNIDIYNMNVAISFEEGVDEGKVKFISNEEDVTNRITFGVEDNVIRAYANDFIIENDLTVKVDLDNYFTNKKSTDGFIAVIMLIIITLLTIILVVKANIEHKSIEEREEHYIIDMRAMPKLLGLIILEAITYLFFNDLNNSLYILYYIVYGLIFLAGVLFILKLKTK